MLAEVKFSEIVLHFCVYNHFLKEMRKINLEKYLYIDNA